MTEMTFKQFQEWLTRQLADYHQAFYKAGQHKQFKATAKPMSHNNSPDPPVR
ncbi:hypothetical protein RBE51_10895 [Pseudomonas taiwanensis]|uniref:hypothetical protein n=1 Tax=Pseudomonas taiwanensis TaxID=470150 RepID=UPI0028DD6330|nr:hypothetical protein [Pseudomonas taiwanensis]MDT8923328.1 hypothetical protein [Pseudomonas taiwanensis]